MNPFCSFCAIFLSAFPNVSNLPLLLSISHLLIIHVVAKQLNPILPGFHPDPSCVFVPTLNSTFFCASSSFNAFPGIPIHASRDLVHWRLLGNVLNRPDQLPDLQKAVGGTSGIWAPALRFHDNRWFLFTTLVFDKKAKEDESRWDNIFFTSTDIFDPASWSDPTHFKFVGYDVSPFWHEDGNVYVHGAHTWEIGPHVDQILLNLNTGEATSQDVLWEGTGGIAPEGPHIYLRNGWYSLLIAEGGTGLGHKVTMARSRNITGPFESNPENPVLTNSNTSSYFQTVGHADLFQDQTGNWWATALSTRSGPAFLSYPMGRETVLTNVSWPDGESWPIFEPVSAEIGGPSLPIADEPSFGGLVDSDDNITFTPPLKSSGFLGPPHFLHWRIPDPSSYNVVSSSTSSSGYSLELSPSSLNLTGLDGNSAATPQTFIGRRQVHSIFEYVVDMEFDPKEGGDEAGITAFLTQNHHIDFTLFCPTSSKNCASDKIMRIHTETTGVIRNDTVLPFPSSLANQTTLSLGVRGINQTHYEFFFGPADSDTGSEQIAGYALTQDVSWGFDGAIVGVFATSNGGANTSPVYVSKWIYRGLDQIRS